MKILIINGPNINMLGIRETNIYGTTTYSDMINLYQKWSKEENIDILTYQSNHEGDLIDRIQQAYYEKVDGIIINPGAYTHTSIGILDALKSVMIPAVEVHISQVDDRESFRKISYVREYCLKTITGMGIEGYRRGLLFLKKYLGGKI